MSTITTRSGKGSPLTNSEVDTNFTNLNTDKLENIAGESIKNLSDVNSSMSPSAGDALVYDASNGWQSGTVSTGAVANTVVVTVANSKFVIDGTSQQALTLSPSVTYRFDQSNNSNANHPLKFSTTDNGTHNSGSEFTTGVTVSGTAGSTDAYVEIKLEQDAPSTLYYYCGNHSGMGGVVSSGGTAVTVQDEGSSLSTAAETLNFTGAGVTASGTGAAKTINIPGATVTTNGSLDPVKQTEFTATANQTSFSVAYGVGNISVYLNGSKLAAADYTATNGTSVALAAGATAGDLVVVEEYGIPFASPYTASVYTASAGQTTLSVSYTVAKVAVFVNGVKLLIGANADVVAANGTSLTFNTALSAGDKIEVVEHGALVESTTTFTGLTDTPSSLGSAGQVAQVNNAGNAIEFADASSGTTTFTGLTDTPSSFGSAGQTLQVNSGTNALEFVDASAGASVYANPSLLPLTGNSAGGMAYVTSTNRFYINNGSGWYSVGLVNLNPTIQSAQDASSNSSPFTFATNGTALVITITASDPEDVPIVYGYSVTSGSLTNGGGTTATVAQGTGSNVNKFTVTPSTTEAYAGTFELTFTASDGINQAQSANSFTLSFITTIPNSRYTVLLAEGQGAGGNSTFDDASTNNHSLTKQRSSTSVDYPVANSFSPYRYGGYSVEFQGTNQSLRTHSFPSNLYLGTENFSMEFWVKTPSLSTSITKIIDHQTNSGSLEFHLYSNRVASFYVNGSGVDFPNSSALDTETWYHLSITKESNFVRGFVNGTQVHAQSVTQSSLNSTTHISLGGQHNFNSTIEKGLKMHDLRIVKGSVLHENNSGTYTYPVPTAPLEEVTGTFLTAYRLPYLAYKRQTSQSDATLIIENMDHIQGSSSDGPPATRPDTPYDGDENTSGTGSSVYFPENGYIDIASSFSGTDFNGNFTCEFWIYLTEKFYTAETTIFAMTGGTIAQVKIDSSQYLSGFKQQARNSEKLPTRCWNHVVMARSGNTINFYVNGERMQRSENSGFSGNSSSKIGARIDGSTRLKNAYISDFRLTAGTALYTAASIVPPTEPLNTPSGTSLHMKGNDGAITDKNASSELLLKPRSGSGQPAGDTTDVVYGGSTIYSNCFSMTGGGQSDVNNGEFIQVPNMTKLEGTEDFTIECWAYPTNISSYQVIFSHGELRLCVGKSGSRNRYTIYLPNKGFNFDYDIDNSYSIPNNAWSFLQLVRDGSSGTKTWKAYLNGSHVWGTTSFGTQSVSTTTTPCIGATPTGGERFKGKIQGLRVSKGLVRPTTVPTSPFKG